MKRNCHCGLEKHRQHFLAKKFGLLGTVLMSLHILFHILECLLLPGILMAFGGHAVEENATAISEEVLLEDGELGSQSSFCRLQITSSLPDKLTALGPLESLCPPR